MSSTTTVILSNERFPESNAAAYLAARYSGAQRVLGRGPHLEYHFCQPPLAENAFIVALDDMWKETLDCAQKNGAKIAVRSDGEDHFTFLQGLFPELADITDTEREVITMFMSRHTLPTKTDNFFLGAQQLYLADVFEMGVDKVREVGETISEHTSKLVENRVASKATTIGDRLALCQATEHVNLTHKALHDLYNKTDITVTYFSTSLPYDSKGDLPVPPLRFTASMRGYNGFDVLVHAKKFGGGGTTSGAGVSDMTYMGFMNLLEYLHGLF